MLKSKKAVPDGISASQSVSGYSAHRERQRSRILDAAEGLFAGSSVSRVSMLAITAAAEVQPSTLYQYFKRKEDIVWALVQRVLADFRDRVEVQMLERQTGFEKIATLLQIMSEDLELRPERVRFMAQFDVLYARSLSVEHLIAIEKQLGLKSFTQLSHWVADGIADRSLRPHLNPEITVQAVLNAAVGTQRRLASLSAKVEQEYGQPPHVLFREAMHILLIGLQSEPPSTKAEKSTKKEVRSKTAPRREQ